MAKHEIRIRQGRTWTASKSETNLSDDSQDSKFKCYNEQNIWNFRIFVIRICFVLRISNFGFIRVIEDGSGAI